MDDDQLDWMDQGHLSLIGNLHYIPRHPKSLLPKFDPNKKTKAQEHIDDFYMHLSMLEVRYNDVSCIIFLYTLEGSASIWYRNPPPNSIHN